MKRAAYLSLLVCCATLAAVYVAALPQTLVHADCGGKNEPKCPPGGGDREKKAQQSTDVPPTATYTATPEPTSTTTPSATATSTPVPTASPSAVAAAIIPPPPSAKGSDCSNSPWGLIAGAVLLGAGGLGYYWSYSTGRPTGGSDNFAWRASQSTGPAGSLDSAFGSGQGNAFDYQHSASQQRVLNTAFGAGSTQPNDRLRGAGPSPRWWGSIASIMALIGGAGTLAANALGSAGVVICRPAPLALVSAGVMAGLLAVLWKRPVLPWLGASDTPELGFDPRRMSIEDAVLLLFMLLSKDAHKDTRELLSEMDAERRKKAALRVVEQRQRAGDVFPDLNDRAASTRLRAIIEVRETPPKETPPGNSDPPEDAANDSDANDDSEDD